MTDDEARLTQLRRGTLPYCVLALLRDQPRYAFDLVRSLAEIDGLMTSEGTIYPLLNRLRRDRLVRSTLQESPTGPPRRYYELTADGTEALTGFAAEWRAFCAAVDTLIAEVPR